ncbi:hypothetical protein LTR04_001945 [Oleoguttula sp. CCFEE 6159]|nr:hypothetical protein LTR04_001945 [Oleoguttula sp. CCFEE 6159]
MGEKIPADVRFAETSTDARFDRSILTGESLPLHGTIAKLTSTPKGGLTPLQKEIYSFIAIIVSLMAVMVIVVIIVWFVWLRKDHPDWILVPNLIVVFVSVAVAFVPEGLPIAVTASLTITAKIMKKNKVLCKSLKTVETLGSVSVICSDKTGTLTKNQMFVTNCMVGKCPISIKTAAKDVQSSAGIQQLALLSGICNSSEFDAATQDSPLEDRKINGDATDTALLHFAETLDSVAEMRRTWNVIFRVAFNSKNKFVIHVIQPFGKSSNYQTDFASEDGTILTIKGAPDILIDRCSRFINSAGTIQALQDEDRNVIEEIKNQWSAQGERVILLARKELPTHLSSIPIHSRKFEQEIMAQATTSLTLIGLVGIVDPPREEIPEVVRTLRGAGIKVHMVTGDFKLTAQAIAAQCGIITQKPGNVHDVSALSCDSGGSPPLSSSSELQTPSSHVARSLVLSGAELNNLDDTHWDRLCRYDEIVFARTTPEQKLRIVKEFQARDEIVGMTGDGVNDAPSLKQADIGIAMGSGSDIAIEAADMVLLDSFSAVVEAVKYGRVVFDNLKKTICYLLPAGTFSEFWPVFTNVVFGLPQILSSFLMIIICCFTDCAAATAIGYEKPEADVLLRRPRSSKKDRLVNWELFLQAYGFLGVLEALSSFAMAYWYAERKGIPFSSLWFGFGIPPTGMSQVHYTAVLHEASSIYFINLVIMQWFNLLAIRTRHLSLFQHPPTRNIYLLPAVLFGFVIAIIFLYIPKLQSVLGTSSVPVEHFFLPIAFGIGLLGLDEGRKWGVRRWPGGVLARIAW